MWVTDSELKCLGTNIRTGRVNSLPKKWSQIFIMFCAVSDSTIFLCKQRSTDSTDLLILAVPCCPEHRGWSYHLQRDVFAEWPPPAVRTVIYCAALPPPNMNQISDEWNLGRLIGTYHFCFTTFEITTIEILRSLEAKNGKSNVFLLDCISNKKNSTEAFTWLETQQTSSNIIKLYTFVE